MTAGARAGTAARRSTPTPPRCRPSTPALHGRAPGRRQRRLVPHLPAATRRPTTRPTSGPRAWAPPAPRPSLTAPDRPQRGRIPSPTSEGPGRCCRPANGGHRLRAGHWPWQVEEFVTTAQGYKRFLMHCPVSSYAIGGLGYMEDTQTQSPPGGSSHLHDAQAVGHHVWPASTSSTTPTRRSQGLLRRRGAARERHPQRIDDYRQFGYLTSPDEAV